MALSPLPAPAPAPAADDSTQDWEGWQVNPATGFMPPTPPLARLPPAWEPWETMLAAGLAGNLVLGDSPGVTTADAARSEQWRASVRAMPVLVFDALADSQTALRRVHLVLAWLLHLYVHTLPPTAPLRIPPPISIPLLAASTALQIPPVLTYSDTVLYNWRPGTPGGGPEAETIRSQTLFTATRDEEEFYLSSARIELRGAEALHILQRVHAAIADAPPGASPAAAAVAADLRQLARVIADLRALLLAIRTHCDPAVYYHAVRPWLRGEDASAAARAWVFEGADRGAAPAERSGPSAGQSALVHALDAALGVDTRIDPAHAVPVFMRRMQAYMPAAHRALLDRVARAPALRAWVLGAGDAGVARAYNDAVGALKEFRDAHMVIVTLYIIGPARRAAEGVPPPGAEATASAGGLKGTGGTDLARFLKGIRDQTAGTIIDV